MGTRPPGHSLTHADRAESDLSTVVVRGWVERGPMIIVNHSGQTGAGRACGSIKGLRVRARKSRCTLKINSERTNKRLGGLI